MSNVLTQANSTQTQTPSKLALGTEKQLFVDLIQESAFNIGSHLNPMLEAYLCSLLLRTYGRPSEVILPHEHPVALFTLEALQSNVPMRTRISHLRNVAEAGLLLISLFPEYVTRRGCLVNNAYYERMSRGAYMTLYAIAMANRRATLNTLAPYVEEVLLHYDLLVATLMNMRYDADQGRIATRLEMSHRASQDVSLKPPTGVTRH